MFTTAYVLGLYWGSVIDSTDVKPQSCNPRIPCSKPYCWFLWCVQPRLWVHEGIWSAHTLSHLVRLLLKTLLKTIGKQRYSSRVWHSKVWLVHSPKRWRATFLTVCGVFSRCWLLPIVPRKSIQIVPLAFFMGNTFQLRQPLLRETWVRLELLLSDRECLRGDAVDIAVITSYRNIVFCFSCFSEDFTHACWSHCFKLFLPFQSKIYMDRHCTEEKISEQECLKIWV